MRGSLVQKSTAVRIQALEALACREVGRGSGALIEACAGNLARVAEELLAGDGPVGLLTGFYLPRFGAAESDGPPGCGMLAAVLEQLGRTVLVATDPRCAAVVAACLPPSTPLLPLRDACAARAAWCAAGVESVLAIEVPGPAADDVCYSMAGAELGPQPGLRALFSAVPRRYAIGDGGNELGLGGLAALTRAHVPHGATIACTVEADAAIVAGVSNWGAAALAGALWLTAGRDGVPRALTVPGLRRRLEAAREAGAVDGVHGARGLSVDGLDWSRQVAFHEALQEVLS